MPMYEHECSCGYETIVISSIAMRDAPVECRCGQNMVRVISKPVIQTISTHIPGKSDGGGYFDYNIRDRTTGQPTYIHSKGQKARLLRERGLVECGDDMELPGAAKRRDDEKHEWKKAVYATGAK